MRSVVEVFIIGGGLPGYLGGSRSGSMSSVPVVSVSLCPTVSSSKRCEEVASEHCFWRQLDSCRCWDWFS
jgi:hypothetical protein